MKSNTYLSEIDFIKNWCITIIDFILINASGNTHLIFQSMKNSLLMPHEQLNKKILNGYREAYRDINECAKSLSPKEYTELNQILTQKFGRNLEDVDKSIVKLIKATVKRGKINNENEYRLLDERANELSQTKPDSSEIKILNEILSDYHQRNRSS